MPRLTSALSMKPLPARGEYWSSQMKPTTASDSTTGTKKIVW